MLTQDQVDFTVNTLLNAVRTHQMRLRTALKNRDDAHDEAERGVENYRIAWLKSCVGTVFVTLEDLARDFNETYPDELCSAEDLKDILMSALRTLAQND